MQKCGVCGKWIEDTAFCPHCGAPAQAPTQASTPPQPPVPPQQPTYSTNLSNYYAQVYGPAIDDAPNTGYWIMGFFIPLLGFIFYGVDKNNRHPQRAQSALSGAIVGMIVGVIVSILVYVIVFFIAYNY